MTTTTNMGLTQSTVGTTTGPDWATNAENNLLTIDAHDHTSGKGVQLTPSSLNINADLEFNLNSATELKNVVLDNAVHASASGDTNNSVYEFDGNLYWRNASGGSVQITSGTAVNTSGGSISGMTANAQVLFSSNSYAFKFDKTLSDPGIAKISHADLDLYKYDAAGSAAKVTLKFLGTGTSAALTVPDETGTLLTTATSFAGTINVATSSSNAPINLKPNGTGHVAVGNGGASGKLTSNGAYDLVLDTNSGTNSGNITITDAADGNISLAPNGAGEIVIGSGSASGKITSSGAHDLVLDTNAGTNSGSITITDGSDGNIAITPNGTGEVDISKVDIDGGTLGGITIDGNWTAAGQTCADLGTVTTADIDGGAIDGVTIGTNSVVTDLRVDNLKFDGNTISSTDTDGDIDISPNGTGSIDLNSGTLDLSAQTVDITLNGAVDALNFDSNTLSIDALNNRVGIGTAAPQNILQVATVDSTQIIFDRMGNNATGTFLDLRKTRHASNPMGGVALNNDDTIGHIRFMGDDGNSAEEFASIKAVVNGTVGNADTPGELQFFTTPDGSATPAQRMTILNDGNIGINKTDPDSLLHIASADPNGTPWQKFSHNGIISWKVYATGSSGSEDDLTFNNSANGDTLTLERNKDVKINDGNLVIGTAGNGITFGGDPNSRINSPSVGSRTLSDYEQGSGNVSVSMSSSGSVGLGPATSGYKYIKIGKIVHFSFEFQTTSVSSPSGTMRVALPFTIRSGMYYAGSLRVYAETFSGSPFLAGSASSTYVELQTNISGSATGNITPTAGTRYHFGSITYECA